MRYIKTVYIGLSNQTAQFKVLKVGQWIAGLGINGKSGLYRGQFMGMDNDNKPIVNFRIDNTKRRVDWKEQFRSNGALRTFAKIKA